MAKWCPECRGEWWREPEVCPDCGVALVADEPPEPERVHHDARDLGGEVEVDLAGAGRSRRWRIELELNNADLPFRWDGDRLHTVDAAIAPLDELDLLDLDEPDDDLPDDEQDPVTARFVPTPPQIVATKVWWAFENPWGTWATIVAVLTIVAGVLGLIELLS